MMYGILNKLFERLINVLVVLFDIDVIMVPYFSLINGKRKLIIHLKCAILLYLYRFEENTDKLSKWLRPFVHSVDFTGAMKGLKDFFAQVIYSEYPFVLPIFLVFVIFNRPTNDSSDTASIFFICYTFNNRDGNYYLKHEAT